MSRNNRRRHGQLAGPVFVLHRAARVLAGLAFVAGAWAHSVHAAGVESSSAVSGPMAWPDTETVHELLRMETQEALALQRQRLRPRLSTNLAGLPLTAELRAGAPSDRVDLAAIYGVGKRLSVEVLVNGHRKRYRHGSKWPDGAPRGGGGAYALLDIEGSCVRLDRASEPRTVCLGSTGGRADKKE